MDLANKAELQEHIRNGVKDLLLSMAHRIMATAYSLSSSEIEFSENEVELQAQFVDLLAKGMK